MGRGFRVGSSGETRYFTGPAFTRPIAVWPVPRPAAMHYSAGHARNAFYFPFALSLGHERKRNMSTRLSPGAQVPAMLLAAGRGERMRPLTDTTPKPLLEVQGQPLLQWHLQALQAAGVEKVVINTAWLGEQICERFSSDFGSKSFIHNARQLSISYSREEADGDGALETAGGIARALPLLGPVFWLAAGDVFAPDFRFDSAAVQAFVASNCLAHLWLVPNPAHNPRGDFGLDAGGLALDLPADSTAPRYTYSTIGLYRRSLFDGLPAGNPDGLSVPLAPLLRAAMARGQVSAELYAGAWTDVGTPERLAALNQAHDIHPNF